MKKTTRKLSGPAKDRFFARFFAEEASLAPEVSERLTAKSITTFTSVRVRRAVGVRRVGEGRVSTMPKSRPPAPQPAPQPPRQTAPPPPAEAPAEAPGEFDPYAFGLVPVYQREGPDGLLERLATIKTLAHLRQMARSQQIGLDPQVKSGDIPIADLRKAIVAAVEKRIADRNAAAR